MVLSPGAEREEEKRAPGLGGAAMADALRPAVWMVLNCAFWFRRFVLWRRAAENPRMECFTQFIPSSQFPVGGRWSMVDGRW